MKNKESMIKYLAMETRYTIEELNKMSDKRIEKWYKEEKNCNA